MAACAALSLLFFFGFFVSCHNKDSKAVGQPSVQTLGQTSDQTVSIDKQIKYYDQLVDKMLNWTQKSENGDQEAAMAMQRLIVQLQEVAGGLATAQASFTSKQRVSFEKITEKIFPH